jgi:hypothetical protein
MPPKTVRGAEPQDPTGSPTAIIHYLGCTTIFANAQPSSQSFTRTRDIGVGHSREPLATPVCAATRIRIRIRIRIRMKKRIRVRSANHDPATTALGRSVLAGNFDWLTEGGITQPEG